MATETDLAESSVLIVDTNTLITQPQLITSAAAIIVVMTEKMRLTLTDSADCADVVSVSVLLPMLLDVLVIADAAAQFATVSNTANDNLAATDQLRTIFRQLAVSALDAADYPVPAKITVLVREFSSLADLLVSSSIRARALMDRVAAKESFFERFRQLAADTMSVADSGAHRALAASIATDVVDLTDAIYQQLTAYSLAADQCQALTDSLTRLLAYTMTRDSAKAADRVIDALGAAGYTALAHTFGMSRYQIQPISSAALVDGKLLVAGDGGIYELRDGADDDGKAVDAFLVTGLLDMGDRLVRPDVLYATYNSQGYMELDVIECGSGDEVTHNYQFDARPTTALTPQRVKLGRGIRSNHIRFRLKNNAGAPFNCSDASVTVIQTGRKI